MPNINIMEEGFSGCIKDEMHLSNAQYLHEECHLHAAQRDAKFITSTLMESPDHAVSGSQLAVDQSLPSLMLEANCSDESGESGNILLCQGSAAVVKSPIISREPGYLNGKSLSDSFCHFF